jgi:drug/metabolite transporter (DMT)-like permease
VKEQGLQGMDTRKPLDSTAFLLMLVLTGLWGFQQVAIKLTAPDVSLVMQAGLRSLIATALLLAWAQWRGTPLFARDGTLAAGLGAGLLFGGEFIFIYGGLEYTAASRMVVFIYLAPVLTALGLHWLVPGEKLARGQWLGVLIAFAGIALAFGEAFAAARGTLLGDVFGMIAALLWAATTVLVRATGLARVSAAKTLFYQLAVSAPMLLAASWLMGEKGVVAVTPLAVASLAYQAVIVAFASYLVWFWLLTRYLAARLAVFSFLSPLFGVLFGVAILGEPLTPAFAGAALLVGAGIVLVNRR